MIYVQREDYSIISHKQASQFAQRKEKKKKKIIEENKNLWSTMYCGKKRSGGIIIRTDKKKS